MTDRDPLTDHDLQRYQAALTALSRQLKAELITFADRGNTVDLDQAAVGRLSRIDAMQQQQMAKAERRRLEVRQQQVERALARVLGDEFGDCLRCGETISIRRLTARPEAPFCIACATTLGA